MALSDRIVVMNRGRVEQIAAPQDAYARPATAFVAQFLGRTNLLPGRVRSESGRDHLQVGEACWALPYSHDSGSVLVTVRPERVVFTSFDGNGLLGTVRARIFHGHEWLHRVETCGGIVTVVTPNGSLPMPAEGETVRLYWDAGDITLTQDAGIIAREPRE
jgi:putative spermidine/putrescine transport system ATP-binding protein